MYIHTYVTLPAFQPASFHINKRGKEVGHSTNPQIQISSSVLKYAVLHCLEQDRYLSWKYTCSVILATVSKITKATDFTNDGTEVPS